MFTAHEFLQKKRKDETRKEEEKNLFTKEIT